MQSIIYVHSSNLDMFNDNVSRKLAYELRKGVHNAVTTEARRICLMLLLTDLHLEYSLSSFSKACSITCLAVLSETHRQQVRGHVNTVSHKQCV